MKPTFGSTVEDIFGPPLPLEFFPFLNLPPSAARFTGPERISITDEPRLFVDQVFTWNHDFGSAIPDRFVGVVVVNVLDPRHPEMVPGTGYVASSPSEDYLTVLAGQRQWIAPTDLPVAPAGPKIALRIAPCSTTSAKFLMRWAGPSTRAFLCRLTPERNSLSRLWPVQISDHSPFTFSSPRSRNCRNPRPCLI